jgi:hypothetical protein
MIRRIEKLEAKFQILSFAHWKLFERRGVPGEQGWSLQFVPHHVAKSSGCRQSKRAHIVKSRRRALFGRQVRRNAGCVQTNLAIASRAGRIDTRLRVDGQSGLPGDDRTNLPSADNLV